MTKNELRDRIAAALEIDPSRLHDDASPKNIKEWDSVGALGILSVMDEATAGGVSSEDALGFLSFAAIVEFARRKGFMSE